MQSARAREHIQHVHACVRACVLARITCMHACVHECIFMRARVYALRKSNVNNNNKVVTTSTHVHGTQTLALAFSHKKTNKSPFKDSIYTLSHEKGTNHFTTFRWWFVHSSEKKNFQLTWDPCLLEPRTEQQNLQTLRHRHQNLSKQNINNNNVNKNFTHSLLLLRTH